MIKLFGKKAQQIELAVTGMTCGHCEMRVQNALKGVAGVIDARADHGRGQAVVKVQNGKDVVMDDLIAAVQEAGYEAKAAAG
jgi:copper chaperone CopZ